MSRLLRETELKTLEFLILDTESHSILNEIKNGIKNNGSYGYIAKNNEPYGYFVDLVDCIRREAMDYRKIAYNYHCDRYADDCTTSENYLALARSTILYAVGAIVGILACKKIGMDFMDFEYDSKGPEFDHECYFFPSYLEKTKYDFNVYAVDDTVKRSIDEAMIESYEKALACYEMSLKLSNEKRNSTDDEYYNVVKKYTL